MPIDPTADSIPQTGSLSRLLPDLCQGTTGRRGRACPVPLSKQPACLARATTTRPPGRAVAPTAGIQRVGIRSKGVSTPAAPDSRTCREQRVVGDGLVPSRCPSSRPVWRGRPQRARQGARSPLRFHCFASGERGDFPARAVAGRGGVTKRPIPAKTATAGTRPTAGHRLHASCAARPATPCPSPCARRTSAPPPKVRRARPSVRRRVPRSTS